MRHLLLLVSMVIVDAIIAVEHGGVSNNGDLDEIDAGASMQFWEGQVTGAEDRRGNLPGEGKRRTGNFGDDWMSNLRDDGNRRTGVFGEDRMSNLPGVDIRRTGNSREDWMDSLQDDGNRRTGVFGEDWKSNLPGVDIRRTGNSREDWMDNLQDDGNSGMGIFGEDRMSNLQDDGNSRMGIFGVDRMSNLRDDGITRTEAGTTGSKRTGDSRHGQVTHRRNSVNRSRRNGRNTQHSNQSNKNTRQESSCPKDFVYIAKLKFCFKVMFERSSTYSAKAKCRQMVSGGRLVQPDSEDKARELTKYLSSKNHGRHSSFAIGSTMKGRGHFTWMDGSPMNYTNWCRGSPNKGKPCVRLISQRRGSDMCMDDGCCFHRGNFICEKPIAHF